VRGRERSRGGAKEGLEVRLNRGEEIKARVMSAQGYAVASASLSVFGKG
jgi:hypothetical protein